jgi:hypothetical protein
VVIVGRFWEIVLEIGEGSGLLGESGDCWLSLATGTASSSIGAGTDTDADTEPLLLCPDGLEEV